MMGRTRWGRDNPYLPVMSRRFAACIVLLLASWLAGCAASPPLPPVDEGPRDRLVFVISNGWHSGVVMSRTAVAATGLVPETADFPDSAFLEFGWGDRAYFPAREKTISMTFDAALTATPAVMHVAGLRRVRASDGSDTDIVPVPLTAGGFNNLVRTIAAEFERSGGGRALKVAPDLAPNSHFYNARGTFHIFNTCNTWTARMMRAAGIDMAPAGIVTADDLMMALREALLLRPPAR